MGPRGLELGGRWEGFQDGGTHLYPWLIHVDVWQKSPQYCKVISLQLKFINLKINLKIKKNCKNNFERKKKQLGGMMIFCFYLDCFTFSISYSVLPFNLVYVF